MAAQRTAEPTLSLKRVSGVLPDGIYQFKVLKSEVKNGNAGPYFATQSKEISGKGMAVFNNLSFSENARFMVEAFLDACGFPPDGPNVRAGQLVGKKFWASVTNKTYQGKMSNIFVAFYTPDAAQALLAEMGEPEEYEGEYEEAGDEEGYSDDGGDPNAPAAFTPNAHLEDAEQLPAQLEADEYPA